jgi:hypothetical protein
LFFTQTEIVKELDIGKGKDEGTKSLIPSKTIQPLLAVLNVGPLVNVPSLPFPLRSLQTFPVPG